MPLPNQWRPRSGCDAPLICYQGGVIQSMDGRLLRNVTFPPETLAPALALAQDRGWQYYLERSGEILLQAGRAYDQALLEIQALPAHRCVNLLHAQPLANQMGVYLPSGVTPEDVDAMQSAFGESAIVFRTHPNFINATPAGVSKGDALIWLAGEMGVPQEAVMAVGDSDNDVSMIAWAGIGVAMGNASAAVKAVADWEAPSFHEHGAAAAVERFVLDHG